MPAEMLLDLAGNKFDPNSISIDDWQSEATALWEATKLAYQGGAVVVNAGADAANHVHNVVDRIFTAWRSDRQRFYDRNPMRVASGYGGDPIKGPMGNSTVSDPSKPMAYGRRNYRNRTSYARRSYGKRKSPGVSKGMAAAVRKIAKRAIRADEELKFLTSVYSVDAPAANVVTINALSNVAQSTTSQTDTTRLGDQIHVRSLEIRGCFRSTGAPATPFRVIIFKWKSSTAPAAASILDSTGSQITFAPLAVDVGRGKAYTVMMDQTFLISAVDGDLTPFIWKFPLDHKVSYLGGSTSSQENGIYIAYVTLAATASIELTSVLKFTDA